MKFPKRLLPAAVLVFGILVAGILMKTRPKTSPEAKEAVRTRVRAMRVVPEQRRMQVVGRGPVVAAESVEVRSELSGRVVSVHPNFKSGGRVEKGDVLARLDGRDYVLAVAQRQAEVERAQFELTVESGRQRIAGREWELLQSDVDEGSTEGRSLALREPHIKNANAALEAAQSSLSLAKLNVERTWIRAPFNSVVLSEFAAHGQMVTPQTVLGQLAATDVYWVQVSLPVAELPLVSIPGVNAGEGSEAVVRQELSSGVVVERSGSVVRLLGDLDPRGRLARVLVEVPNPLAAGTDGSSPFPLLLGAYVEVEISGRVLDGVYRVPRTALRDGKDVWRVDSGDRLEIRPVAIGWRDVDAVYVSDGLSPGDRIIVSRVPTASPGLLLDVVEDGDAERVPGTVTSTRIKAGGDPEPTNAALVTQ
jgi:RND family efflux transporter MFP subunit